MVAAVFELKSWLGTHYHFCEGEDAAGVLDKFEKVQDLNCLVRMGRGREKKKGQESLDRIQDILMKKYSGHLQMEDIKNFNIEISLGSFKCLGTAEGEEEIKALKEMYPDGKR